MHYDVQTEGKCLAQAEASLGDHVTGGVVQRWRQVQRKLGDLLSEGTNPSVNNLRSDIRSEVFARCEKMRINKICSFVMMQAKLESVLTATNSLLG